MTRDELLTAVKAYTHTMDLGPEDTLIELVEARINQEVRAPEMVTYTTIDTEATAAVANNAWQLPTDFLQMKDVFADIGGRRCTLQARGRDAINAASASTASAPLFYAVYDSLIEFQPGPGERVITLLYYAKPTALVDDADTNDMIAAHPALYLYGTLAHWYQVAQDTEQLVIAQQGFDAEVARVNLYGWQQPIGTSPVASGAGNNYTARGARL